MNTIAAEGQPAPHGRRGKKILVLALALSLFTAFGASAYTAAIGGEFALRIGNGLPNSALLSFRLPKFPPVFGLGLSIPGNGEHSSFVLLADWWLASGNLVGFVNYYIGPGIFLAISNGAQFGLRVPIGINAFPIKPLELFLELAPAAYLVDSSGGITIPNFGLQSGFGFRFWF
jgi:hypothetical protein